jgi:DNA replication protein DnaC
MEPINLLQQHLQTLKLKGIILGLETRLQEAQREQFGFPQFLSLCLEDEVQYRKQAHVVRLIKSAGFKAQQASCEGIDYTARRSLDKKLIQELSTCRYIREGFNVLISGPTGVGKSHVSTALGNAACRSGFSTHFVRMNTLIEKFTLARVQGTYLNLVKKLSQVDLLIIDDLGIKPLIPQQFQDLYDILDERYETKSTIITTQLPVENWPEIIADPVTCEAITDRVVTKSVRIQMSGESYRKKRFKQPTVDSN